MVVISYLYFVCFYLGGACSETACCGMGTQGFSNETGLRVAKSVLFWAFQTFFILDCPALLTDEMASFSEHLDH